MALILFGVCGLAFSWAQFADPAAAPASASTIPQEKLIHPEALHGVLHSSGAKPLVLQVGSHVMFTQAHILGAQYAGPGATPAGLQLLESKVAGLPKTTPIVIYCGCCPWSRCPNVGPAFSRLRQLGFTKVKVLYIADNFGADWVQKGYDVAAGG